MGSDEVRRSAARVRHVGDEVRGLADRALTAASAQWRSTAATGFRSRVADEVARLRITATALDDAAEALLRHAVAVDTVRPGLGGGR